jgi:hypothetical protein
MNEFVPDPLVTTLRGLYQSDENARQLFDHFAKRQNKATFTTAEAVETATGALRGDAVDLLKRLADLGLGSYYIGRRGSSTRIEWDFDIREVGKAAQGQVKSLTVEREGDGEDDFEAEVYDQLAEAAKPGTIQHQYQLRADFQLQVVLPTNLTDREAERIGTWVRSLPFGT